MEKAATLVQQRESTNEPESGSVAEARRLGGRAARIALRKSKHTNRSVAAGLEGGRYKPLLEAEVAAIYATALDILSEIGIADPVPEIRDLAVAAGCQLTADGRLLFPRSLMDDVVANAGRDFTLFGRDPSHHMQISGNRVHLGTTGLAVKMLDFASGKLRATTIEDLFDFARLVDVLDNIHYFSRTVVATEIQDLLAYDLTVAYACIAGTKKHFFTGFTEAAHVKPAMEMFDAIAGGEGCFKKAPYLSANTCAIVSPLKFGADNLYVAIECARHGIPINMIIAGQAGATAPAALAGTLAQNLAETLGGLAAVHLVRPGHPVIFGSWPFVSDLRTGAFSGGSGEQALLMASSAQITRWLGLPCGVAAGMTDSKLPDNQAGYEKGITLALAAAAGANLINASAGIYASLLTAAFEGAVIDNDLYGATQRVVRGIEVNSTTLSIDPIREAISGVGHYLGSDQTLSLMESEYLYPELADRMSPDDWEERGSRDIRQCARERADQILSRHYPSYIEPSVDERIRSRLSIQLSHESMSSGNGRWGASS